MSAGFGSEKESGEKQRLGQAQFQSRLNFRGAEDFVSEFAPGINRGARIGSCSRHTATRGGNYGPSVLVLRVDVQTYTIRHRDTRSTIRATSRPSTMGPSTTILQQAPSLANIPVDDKLEAAKECQAGTAPSRSFDQEALGMLQLT